MFLSTPHALSEQGDRPWSDFGNTLPSSCLPAPSEIFRYDQCASTCSVNWLNDLIVSFTVQDSPNPMTVPQVPGGIGHFCK